ncbi:hypothetical protein DPMN_095557 [Dreissena polymorpha]|uniref:Uncharacterized protein n=1 Tax=Dreissena polymorpha TaxID=45954 RepID=A0A9D4R2Z7_DREPO|nr:hypothetical protein DPMN_095557 [Dreissena polymorpha]
MPSNMTLQLPPDFISGIQNAIKDGMSDATVSVSGGGESIWAKLFGIGVQTISTVGGDIGAAALSAAIETEGNVVNSAIEGLIQGTVNALVESTVQAAVTAVSDRLTKETQNGVNKLMDELFGKQKEEDRSRDRQINNTQLQIEELKKQLKDLSDKFTDMQNLDITKALAVQGNVRKNTDAITALQARLENNEKAVQRQETTLTDTLDLAQHNVVKLTSVEQYVNTYLKKMVIPYQMETYPEMFARLYNNQIGLSNAINSVGITQGLKLEYMVAGVPSVHVPGTG